MTLDPNTIFNALVKEAQDAQGAGASDQPSSAGTQLATNFNLDFFNKLASGDEQANTELNDFVSAALAEGHTPDEITAAVAELESEARGGTAETSDAPASANDAGGDEDASEFDMAKAAAEAEAIEQAIVDELENSDLAKIAGVDREALEAWLVGEAGGEAYVHARHGVNEIVEKIASCVVPSDELVAAAVKVAKDAGLDVSGIEAEMAAVEKTAATAAASESQAAKTAQAMADAEEALFESLIVLKTAGVDVTKLAADAEGKKKMSGAKKALIAGGSLAALGGGAYALSRHAGIHAAASAGAGKVKDKAGAAYNYAKSKMPKMGKK